MRHASPRDRLTLALAIVAGLLSLPAGVRAAEYTVDRDATLFAIVTHKAGIASAAFGHNHIIFPEDYTVSLNIDPHDITAASFHLEFAAESLAQADNDAVANWFPDLEAAGILEKLPRKTSRTNREKIREHMLSMKQLDAENHPTVVVKLRDLREKAREDAEEPHTHVATIDLTVHGETVTLDCPATITFDDEDALHVEAFAELKFTDFGIKPYASLFGALKNQDAFHLYLNLTASESEP